MKNFVKVIDKNSFQIEMKVNMEIFDKRIVLRAAYELVDKVYMFFDKEENYYIVQFKLKDEKNNIEDIINSFQEELVYHKLRDDIEKQTGKFREDIVGTALWYGVSVEDIEADIKRISIPVFNNENKEISVDSVIADIENDPEFTDEKDDIIKLLKKIDNDM